MFSHAFALRLGVLLLLAPILVACESIDAYIAADAVASNARYVVITPTGRDCLPCVQRFVARKAQEGFDVRVVTFENDGEVRSRLSDVRRQLDSLEPNADELAYVLFLATANELPMGPWRVEENDATIQSDLPLLVGFTDPSLPLTEADWWRAAGSDLRWIPGRIPYADETLLDQVFAASDALASRASPPLALLGSERYAVWCDTALVQSRVRRQMEERGWRTITYGEDSPCDVDLGLRDAEDLRNTYSAAGLWFDPLRLQHYVDWLTSFAEDLPEGVTYVDPSQAPTNSDLLFLSHWAALAPDVVYLNSHGSSRGVGQFLVSAYDIGRIARETTIQSRPSEPAFVVIAACEAGAPDSDVTRALFEHGYAGAVVASTEKTSPTPIHSAIRAEIDGGAILGSSLTVGLGLRAMRRSYLDDARDTWSYAWFDETAPLLARNLLALTLYGDPSVPIGPNGRRAIVTLRQE